MIVQRNHRSPIRFGVVKPRFKSVRALHTGWVLAVIAFAAAPNGWACNIPVFRYALERWKPDPCEVIVFVDKPLSGQHRSIIDGIAGEIDRSHANIKLTTVNVQSSPDAAEVQIWKGLEKSAGVELPYAIVRTTLGRGRQVNHWHGTLEQIGQSKLMRSPVRERIRARLLAGDSVVWLLVKSADEERNRAAEELLQNTFSTLATKVKLPEGIGLPGSELYADIPLVVRFRVVEMQAGDPQETYLSSLLVGIRKQAYDRGEPLLVPIFGRGRALEVIPAEDANAKLVEELTVFLSGACSCQVKEQNPGFDLLIDADWDTELFGDEANRPPDRSDQEGRNRQPQLLTIPPGRR